MIVVVFALPDESREFRRGIGAVRAENDSWTGAIGGRLVRIIHCGVGPEAAARSGSSLFENERPEFVVMAGFGGALAPNLGTGDLMLVANFSDAGLLARAASFAKNASIGALISVDLPVESVAEKRALAASSGAIAVDMETAALAASCQRAGVPLLAIRAISDRADEPLPVPFAVWFDLANQQPRVASLLRFLARYPQRIFAFARFVRGLRPARETLADFLLRFLAE